MLLFFLSLQTLILIGTLAFWNCTKKYKILLMICILFSVVRLIGAFLDQDALSLNSKLHERYGDVLNYMSDPNDKEAWKFMIKSEIIEGYGDRVKGKERLKKRIKGSETVSPYSCYEGIEPYLNTSELETNFVYLNLALIKLKELKNPSYLDFNDFVIKVEEVVKILESLGRGIVAINIDEIKSLKIDNENMAKTISNLNGIIEVIQKEIENTNTLIKKSKEKTVEKLKAEYEMKDQEIDGKTIEWSKNTKYKFKKQHENAIILISGNGFAPKNMYQLEIQYLQTKPYDVHCLANEINKDLDTMCNTSFDIKEEKMRKLLVDFLDKTDYKQIIFFTYEAIILMNILINLDEQTKKKIKKIILYDSVYSQNDNFKNNFLSRVTPILFKNYIQDSKNMHFYINGQFPIFFTHKNCFLFYRHFSCFFISNLIDYDRKNRKNLEIMLKQYGDKLVFFDCSEKLGKKIEEYNKKTAEAKVFYKKIEEENINSIGLEYYNKLFTILDNEKIFIDT